MTSTLAWKEVREHQGVWLTMVVMTVLMGSGLVRLVAPGDSDLSVGTAALTILGMAVAYGAVCGAMMFAGEHEGGTMVFLDVFWGRRREIWWGKFLVGVALVVTQGLVVASILRFLEQQLPHWAWALVGHPSDFPRGFADVNVWFLILPVVAFESFAWGMLGSSLLNRVLPSAAVAAGGVTPVWLLAILAPPQAFFPIRIILALILLAYSYSLFVKQSREESLAPGRTSSSAPPVDRRDRFLEIWDSYEREGNSRRRRRSRWTEPNEPRGPDDEPFPAPAEEWPAPTRPVAKSAATIDAPAPSIALEMAENAPELTQAESANEVLWWLTMEQARPLLWIMGIVLAVCLMLGFLVPISAHGLWPWVSLALGVVCGVAAFAPEQRDFSYLFLSTQHFPIGAIWRYKIRFWLVVTLLAGLIVVVGHTMNVSLRRLPQHDGLALTRGFEGPLRELMGSFSYFVMWPLYGFAAGQLVVWYCRKNVLALLIGCLVSAGGIGLWLPSILCGGMRSWPLLAPPLILIGGAAGLARAWMTGRIQERKPVAAVGVLGTAILAWVALVAGNRATQVPDVGAPFDTAAFRASLPAPNGNDAGRLINFAAQEFSEPDNDQWQATLAKIVPLPLGVLEMPRGDDQAPLLKELPTCQKMADELLRNVFWRDPNSAIDNMVVILALSRNLRNKAPINSYLAGVAIERNAFDGLDGLLARGEPDVKILGRVFDELNRHAVETPPLLDCLHTECFRSAGVLANPALWAARDERTFSQRWLPNAVALSLETPWEASRKTRLWRAVWGGLMRGGETPSWQLSPEANPITATKVASHKILKDWLPAMDGQGLSKQQVATWLDQSWLADEQLFPPVAPLRVAATRSRWRVDSSRLVVALSRYRLETGKLARDLDELAPKYFPGGLPIDPYSGQPFRYRIAGDQAVLPAGAEVGDGLLWSTGPDRIDHGGRRNGSHLSDDNDRWANGQLDLIKVTPRWLR
jgi:hypothetical protein